jgi:uncharacterized membrane protein YkoI
MEIHLYLLLEIHFWWFDCNQTLYQFIPLCMAHLTCERRVVMSKNSLVTAALACFILSTTPPAMAAEIATGIMETGLRKAVDVALEHTPGQVLEVEREHKDGKQVYEIDIVHGSQITEVSVDIVAQKVIRAKTDDLKHRVKKSLIPDETLAALRGAKVTLPEAILKAEEAKPAKAAEAEFKREDGQYVYKIKMEANEKHMKVLVDANTGELRNKD